MPRSAATRTPASRPRGEQPIARDAVRAAGIEVVVAGRRYGKGSSREHSVVAEAAAGVRLVIAESFERIYRQNADNVGLLTSTDFGLVERIQRGEPIALDELLAGRDALTAAIVRAGGLLAYGKARLRGARRKPRGARRTHRRGRARCSRRSSIATRIATADTPARLAPGQGGFVRADLRFIHEYYTGMCAHLLQQRSATRWRCTSRRASSPSRTICRTCTAARCTWRRGWSAT